jgi:hypothetical protein
MNCCLIELTPELNASGIKSVTSTLKWIIWLCEHVQYVSNMKCWFIELTPEPNVSGIRSVKSTFKFKLWISKR